MNLEKWRHYFRAQLFGWLKRDELALAEYEQAFRNDPDFFDAANALGYRHALAGRHAEALRYYGEALRTRPKDANVHFNVGFIYEKLHDNARALDSFRRAVELNAKHDLAWYGMGLALAGLGRHEEAAEAFEQTTRMKPLHGTAWYQLGMACHHSQQTERLRYIIKHLDRFDRRTARRLIIETGTSDLAYLVRDLVV